jgi:hypothetical protein
MPLFGKNRSHQQRSRPSRRTPPPGWKPPPPRPKLTKEEERKRLEEFAIDSLGMDFEDNEELVRYIYNHVREGGNFIIKKLINKRAVKSLSSGEWSDFPTQELVEQWVYWDQGFGPGTYVVLPAGKNRILARYEIREW